jgi:LacI family transcriptional regulator
MASNPNILEIAKLAGVSKSTAARALSGHPNVSAKSRKLVEAAAASAGYQRNHVAAALRTGRIGVFGLVVRDIANPFWAELARGAQDEAEANGRSVIVLNSDWDAAREERHVASLLSTQVEGILISPVTRCLELVRSETPMVALGSAGEGSPNTSYVRTDVDQGVRLGLGHLLARGHRRIGFIVGRSDRRAYRHLMSAIKATTAAYSVDASGFMFEEGDYFPASGEAAASRMLDCAGPTITAVFAANDLMALGAMRAARARQLDVPADLSIVGMDGIEAGTFTHPVLTTVVKPATAMGREAVRALLREIREGGARTRSTLPCTLRTGGTVSTIAVRSRDVIETVVEGEI